MGFINAFITGCLTVIALVPLATKVFCLPTILTDVCCRVALFTIFKHSVTRWTSVKETATFALSYGWMFHITLWTDQMFNAIALDKVIA